MANGVLHPSRTAILRGLAIGASLAYLTMTVVLLAAVEPLGIAYVWLARVIVTFGATFAAMLLLPGGRARSWLRLQIAKHLFRHRYDYRAEWLRFTRTLGGGEGGARRTTRSPAGSSAHSPTSPSRRPRGCWCRPIRAGSSRRMRGRGRTA